MAVVAACSASAICREHVDSWLIELHDEVENSFTVELKETTPVKSGGAEGGGELCSGNGTGYSVNVSPSWMPKLERLCDTLLSTLSPYMSSCSWPLDITKEMIDFSPPIVSFIT